jgi:hypothetical protein
MDALSCSRVICSGAINYRKTLQTLGVHGIIGVMKTPPPEFWATSMYHIYENRHFIITYLTTAVDVQGISFETAYVDEIADLQMRIALGEVIEILASAPGSMDFYHRFIWPGQTGFIRGPLESWKHFV